MSNKIDISIVILTYNVKYFLENTLHSIYKSETNYNYEIIIVDNNSIDNTQQYITKIFPKVKYIFNKDNLGFAKGNNIGLKEAKGKFILVLNPDTHIYSNTLQKMVDYLKHDSSCDMCSCKLVTPDGITDENCHRSFPTVWNSFSYISGLAKIFPRSKLFSSYLLTYKAENEIFEVDAISGSFMFFKREIIDSGIFFPEYYFMYGEDLDFCYKVRQNGYNIKYVPQAETIHYKGQSSKKDRIKSRKYFFESMSIFVGKNYSRKYSKIFRFFINIAIFIAYLSSIMSILSKKVFTPIMDTISFILALVTALYLYKPSLQLIAKKYSYGLTELTIQDYILPTIIYLTLLYIIFSSFHIYTKHKKSFRKYINAFFAYGGSAIAVTYFFKFFAHSRLLLIFLLTTHSAIMLLWRFCLFSRLNIYKENALIIGIDDISKELLNHKNEIQKSGYNIKGFLDLEKNYLGKDIQGMPVLGNANNIKDIVKQELIETVIFSIKSTGLNKIRKDITILKENGINYKLLPDFLEIKHKKIKFIEFRET